MLSLRRWSRPLRHRLAYGALRLLIALFRLLPLKLSLALGALLGRGLGRLVLKDRRRMRLQLGLLNDPPSPGACFADLGRRFAELACAARLLPYFYLEREERERLDALLAQPRGCLFLTAHLGNWELLAAALASWGYEVHSIAARQKEGPLYRWLAQERARLGVQLYLPGGGAEASLRRLRGGGSLGIFIDQATQERSCMIPFLGYPAPTPLTAQWLQESTGSAAALIWALRDSDGRYKLQLKILPEEGLLEAATAHLEQLVRSQPQQWIWLHPRWGAAFPFSFHPS